MAIQSFARLLHNFVQTFRFFDPFPKAFAAYVDERVNGARISADSDFIFG